MNKQFKTNKKSQSNHNIEHQSEELDIRLQRQVKLSSKLQNQLTQSKEQIEFCAQYFNNLKQQHQKIKQHTLLARSNHFGGWDTKLKQLTVQSLQLDAGFSQANAQQKRKKQSKLVICSQKKHLQEILDEKIRKTEEEQVAKLEEKLKGLYSKIQKMVMQEFMNEKIMNKIRKQSRKASKVKTIQFIEKQISKYKNWVDENTKKINNQRTVKEIEEKIVFNLELMKLLMTKKIINNDYIYQQFIEKQVENMKNLQNITTVPIRIQQNYQYIAKTYKKYNSQAIESQNTSIIHKQDANPQTFQFETVTDYLSQVETTLANIQRYDFKQKIEQKCRKVQSRLDELAGSVKK